MFLGIYLQEPSRLRGRAEAGLFELRTYGFGKQSAFEAGY